MSEENEEIDRAAEQLSLELALSHDAIMAVHRFAETHADSAVQLDCMRAAARMMQAQAAVALSLKRLRSAETSYAFHYIHEGVPPTPEKSKTKSRPPVGKEPLFQELWEDPETGEWLDSPPKP